MKFIIKESDKKKAVISEKYNYTFDKETGEFYRWGKTTKTEDDPIMAPSPEIADIEITTSCDNNCEYCYKANNPNGKNMSYETFTNIIDKLLPILNQVALGVDAKCEANPDTFRMMEYCRSKGVIPNLTVANISEETAQKITLLAGACAVSYHGDKDKCFNSIDRLSKAGLKVVNMHYVISQETYFDVFNILDDIKSDPRLKNMTAIVFLALKKKGRGIDHQIITQHQMNNIINYATEKNIGIGFDSCGTLKYLESIKDDLDYDAKRIYVEDCESTLFSSYFDTDGIFYPCSFSEGHTHKVIDNSSIKLAYKVIDHNWTKGIPMTKDTDFLKDVWHHEKTIQFRKALLNTKKNNSHNCRECPYFEI